MTVPWVLGVDVCRVSGAVAEFCWLAEVWFDWANAGAWSRKAVRFQKRQRQRHGRWSECEKPLDYALRYSPFPS